MSLPYRQQWQLRHIDRALRRSDPQLAAMLAIFARLTADEKIGDKERLRVPAWLLLTWLLGSVAGLGIWVVRGVSRVGARIMTALCALRRMPLLRRTRSGAGNTQPGLGHAR